jgi:hypothetical protein
MKLGGDRIVFCNGFFYREGVELCIEEVREAECEGVAGATGALVEYAHWKDREAHRRDPTPPGRPGCCGGCGRAAGEFHAVRCPVGGGGVVLIGQVVQLGGSQPIVPMVLRPRDNLIVFLYLLLRDELPAGRAEKIAVQVEASAGEVEISLSNAFLAGYARSLAGRLREPEPKVSSEELPEASRIALRRHDAIRLIARYAGRHGTIDVPVAISAALDHDLTIQQRSELFSAIAVLTGRWADIR